MRTQTTKPTKNQIAPAKAGATTTPTQAPQATGAPTTASAPAQTTATAPSPPTKRKLSGWVAELKADGHLSGSLVHLRAEYQAHRDAVLIGFELEDYDGVGLLADHVQARAAIATLRRSLDEFARYHRGISRVWADPPRRAQVNCYTDATSGEDEEIRCEFLPQRDLIQLHARLSDGDKSYTVWAYLTRTEAEALLHDLERGLVDLERYGDIGI